MITETMRLSTEKAPGRVIAAVQGESQSRELRFSLLDARGDCVSMKDAAVSLYVKKPSGMLLMLPGTVEEAETGEEAVFVLTGQVCTEAGYCRSWLQLVYSDQEDLRAEGPEIFVRDCVTDEAVESREEFTALEEALAQTAAYGSHVQSRENPHETTAEQVGARPSDWMPTAQQVGARPSDWIPSALETGAVPLERTVNGKPLSSNIQLSASDVGARASGWLPTAQEVGAISASSVVEISQGGTGVTDLTALRSVIGSRAINNYWGSFSSGTATISNGALYELLLFLVYAGSETMLSTMAVPTAFVSSGSYTFKISSEASAKTIGLSISGNDIVMAASGGTGTVKAVYGCLKRETPVGA